MKVYAKYLLGLVVVLLTPAVAALVNSNVGISGGMLSSEEGLTLKEKSALDKFKALVIPQIPSTSYLQNYVQSDSFFLRWLQVKFMDVGKAEKMFLKHLKWRERESVDTILDENWTTYPEQYPVRSTGFDKWGRPVVEGYLSSWDIRKAGEAGEMESLLRWTTRLLEEQNRRIYESAWTNGNVTQSVQLIELDGRHLHKVLCSACLGFFARVAEILESNYPSMWNGAYSINSPTGFDTIWILVRSLLRTNTRKAIKIFRSGDSWREFLDQRIERTQRTTTFGGTIIRI